MVLTGEVRQMLAAGGEHDPVDLGLGPLPRERHLLIDLGQARSETADGPLQRGIAADDRSLAAEVPGRLVPVLDVDQSQLRALRQEDFESADVQPGGFASPLPARLAHQSRLGPFFEHDQRVAQNRRGLILPCRPGCRAGPRA